MGAQNAQWGFEQKSNRFASMNHQSGTCTYPCKKGCWEGMLAAPGHIPGTDSDTEKAPNLKVKVIFKG